MPMYSRQTSVSTQLGGRPAIVFSGDVSSTRQHSNRGHATKEEVWYLLKATERRLSWLHVRHVPDVDVVCFGLVNRSPVRINEVTLRRARLVLG